MQIASLANLIHELTKLPGIGEKTAQRLAHFILRSGSNYSESLQNALREVQEKVHSCSQCFSFTDNVDLCSYCLDTKRDETLLCVVEEPSDILKVETSAAFRGQYHVLQGALAPLDGVLPEDLRIQELMNRLKDPNSKITELILAFDADIEGDTTALYLAKIVKPLSIKISRLAHGVPFGSHIDYIDRRTIGRALENRVEL
jgi:recombination protein RecR